MMDTIYQKSLAAALSFTIALGISVASAQQQAPDSQSRQDAPAQQTAPAQPGPSMGHEMMREGMEHGKMGQQMGRKAMEGEHGRMGPGMKQSGSAPTNDSGATTGANQSTNSNTTPSTGSK